MVTTTVVGAGSTDLASSPPWQPSTPPSITVIPMRLEPIRIRCSTESGGGLFRQDWTKWVCARAAASVSGVTFTAAPKAGLGRFHPLYRAEILESASGTRAEVADLSLAEYLAALLNDAEAGVLPERVESDAPLPHYQEYGDPQGRGRRVVARFRGAYPDRYIARTEDERLAGRIAFLLNRVDPGAKIRVRFGVGWW